LIVLAFFGQRIVNQWSWRLRQRELDRAAAAKINKNFGEFQAVLRLGLIERTSVPTVEEVRACQAEIMSGDSGKDCCPGSIHS
jgi:hypothetical protein